MPGKEQCDGFIAELFVGHARAIFVLRAEKHGEKITGIAPGSSALSDDAIEDAFDEGNFALDAQVRGRGHPMRNEERAPEIGSEFEIGRASCRERVWTVV